MQRAPTTEAGFEDEASQQPASDGDFSSTTVQNWILTSWERLEANWFPELHTKNQPSNTFIFNLVKPRAENLLGHAGPGLLTYRTVIQRRKFLQRMADKCKKRWLRHAKTPNTMHQGNVNQNHKISPYACQESHYKKTKRNQKIINAGDDMEKLEPLCTIVKRCSHYRKQYRSSSKI